MAEAPTTTTTEPEAPEHPVVAPPADMVFVSQASMHTYNSFLYGPPKVGKTVAAATMARRGSVIYLNGDLPDATWFIHDLYGTWPNGNIIEPLLKDWEAGRRHAWEMLAWARREAAKPVDQRVGGANTMIFDPVGRWYTRLLEDRSNRSVSPSLPAYQSVGIEIRRFCYEMCKADINFIMIAHEIVDGTGDDAEHIPFTGTKAGSPDMGKELESLVSILAYCGMTQERNEAGEVVGKKYVAQLASGKGRQAGDRSDTLGIVEDLDLEAWITRIEAKRLERKTANVGTNSKEK